MAASARAQERFFPSCGGSKLLREIRIAKRAVLDGTKFDRFLSYRIVNLHYLVAEEKLIGVHEVSTGWGLLLRRGHRLELLVKPLWQTIGVEEQLIFLQRMTAKKSMITATAHPYDSILQQ